MHRLRIIMCETRSRNFIFYTTARTMIKIHILLQILYAGFRKWLLMAYSVENVERQPFWDISDLQAVGDRSIAAVLASRGLQGFYLNINVPAFFNTIGRKRT